ncbi:MAG: aminotransferase class I/II-fold pyridoxal phosphate-dependent enzyme, partial [Firmicutes bacterium]|nr:aminotransferase class I/II-fold pyridoxal phosphate-dependent enzyme [Bacillota bacterium]
MKLYNMTFTEFLENHISKETVSFHMPGHKGRSVFDLHGMGALIDNLVDGDITEIPGSDNLSQPQGIIRNVMDRYKTLYGSEESFVSVGGSTLGLMASVLAVYSYGMYKSETIGDGRETAEAETEDETYEGGDSKKLAIAVARNSHKSIFNGIALSDADPIFIRPEIFDCGIVGEITAETVANAFSRAAEEERKICAVVVPNPNYYGICSPIKEIARVVHEHNAILIVDQAHGAHLRFMYPELSADICECGAITQGDRCAIGQGDCCARDMLDCADIVVESTHKTLASFTQTAIINVYNKELVSAVEEKVKLMQSTSPSYILMKSLDMNVELIENYGESLFESWRMNIDKTYTALDELGINYLEYPLHDRS